MEESNPFVMVPQCSACGIASALFNSFLSGRITSHLDQSNENVTSLLESVDLAGDPHDQTTDQHDSDQSKVNEPVAARPKPVFVDEASHDSPQLQAVTPFETPVSSPMSTPHGPPSVSRLSEGAPRMDSAPASPSKFDAEPAASSLPQNFYTFADEQFLNELERNARQSALNLTALAGHLRAQLQHMSSLSVQYMKLHKMSVDNVGTEIHDSVIALHSLIMKAQQLNKDLHQTEQLKRDIAETKKALDQFDQYLARFLKPLAPPKR